MLHFRIVAPPDDADETLRLLYDEPAVCNVIHLSGAARKPDGDVILCDVAREEASVVLGDLREMDIPRVGSIAVEAIDTSISAAARQAEEAAAGPGSDAVVWEEVEERTSEQAELSISLLAFMVIATLIAGTGILLDSQILVIGAMVVGPEFGPLAGFCVALVQGRRDLARRSLAALALGFPLAIVITLAATLALRALALVPTDPAQAPHPFTQFVSQPDVFSFFVAYLAGTAGILSLTAAKSGALIGVLISVTTVPAAANVGVATAYGDTAEAVGAAEQLLLNLGAIVLAGVLTLAVQRRYYRARRERHLRRHPRPGTEPPSGGTERSGGG